MVTANDVFNATLVLIDEVTETGLINSDLQDYYKAKAITIMNMLQADLLPLDTEPVAVTSLDDDLQMPYRDAIKVLPYGVAAHLLIQDDQASSAYYNNMYDELKRHRQATQGQTEDKYNILSGLDGVF